MLQRPEQFNWIWKKHAKALQGKKKQTKHKPSKHMQQKYAAYPVNTTKLLCEQKQNRAFPQIFKSESIIRYVLNTNTAIPDTPAVGTYYTVTLLIVQLVIAPAVDFFTGQSVFQICFYTTLTCVMWNTVCVCTPSHRGQVNMKRSSPPVTWQQGWQGCTNMLGSFSSNSPLDAVSA